MKNNIKIIDSDVYGAGGSGKLVSFGFGTASQAYADRTEGGINYGHEVDVETGHDFGCQYMEGMLISSRVLDIVVGSSDASGQTPVRVVYVDAGEVKTHEFVTVDKELVDTLINTAVTELEQKIADASVFIPEYEGSEYVQIAPDGSNYVVSVKYDELFTKINSDMNIDDINQELESIDSSIRVIWEELNKKEQGWIDVSTLLQENEEEDGD